MIQKVPTQYERFLTLVNVIGTKHKAGCKEATADLERLEKFMLKAIGIFQLNAEEKLGAIIDASVPDPESGEARRLRREREHAARKEELKAAQEIVNSLSAKYGVQDVFRSDTTPELIATELAGMAADALAPDQSSDKV